MRSAPAAFLASIFFALVLALGAIAVALMLLIAPVLLLSARLLHPSHRAPRSRSSRGAVYEGEFRVLDETAEERP